MPCCNDGVNYSIHQLALKLSIYQPKENPAGMDSQSSDCSLAAAFPPVDRQ
jgi:hypothetical protein